MGFTRISGFQNFRISVFHSPQMYGLRDRGEGDSERPLSGGVDVRWMAIITLGMITVLLSSANGLNRSRGSGAPL